MRFAVLCAAVLIVAIPAQAQDAVRIDVMLSNFKFAPKTITLRHGQPYVLHLTNTASGGHDFVAKEFFAAARVSPADRAVAASGEVEVGGGESRDVHFIAPAAGAYKVHCSHFMHSTFGMTGEIVVS